MYFVKKMVRGRRSPCFFDQRKPSGATKKLVFSSLWTTSDKVFQFLAVAWHIFGEKFRFFGRGTFVIAS